MHDESITESVKKHLMSSRLSESLSHVVTLLAVGI